MITNLTPVNNYSTILLQFPNQACFEVIKFRMSYITLRRHVKEAEKSVKL